jgi:hypothetical protein
MNRPILRAIACHLSPFVCKMHANEKAEETNKYHLFIQEQFAPFFAKATERRGENRRDYSVVIPL